MNEDSHSPGARAPSAALLGPRASGPPGGPEARGPRRRPISPARIAAHALIRAYQLTLSGLLGRQCRYLPTCSAYTDEAIARHGVWAGGWMGAARICRCHPLGGAGYDPPPQAPHAGASWLRPWRYGQWRAPAAAD